MFVWPFANRQNNPINKARHNQNNISSDLGVFIGNTMLFNS